ncbi:MAG TPA: CoA pyrophosphatase, partial [Polyangiaceae bacterium]|nr:CoA pyrophosphatase [Polyangiaceae bacterium]
MIERIDLARVRLALQAHAADSAVHLDSSKRHAAVAAVLRDAEHGAEALLIRRAAREGDPWSGHMAFPGGQREPHDQDLLDTAVRETHEEIGLDLREHAALLGRLETLPAVAGGRRIGMNVTPFVFELRSEPP